MSVETKSCDQCFNSSPIPGYLELEGHAMCASVTQSRTKVIYRSTYSRKLEVTGATYKFERKSKTRTSKQMSSILFFFIISLDLFATLSLIHLFCYVDTGVRVFVSVVFVVSFLCVFSVVIYFP